MNKKRCKQLRAHPDFFEKVEAERRKFMVKNNLTKLSTSNFTKILEVKVKRRRK